MPESAGFTDEDVTRYVVWHLLRGRLVVYAPEGEPTGAAFISRVEDPRRLPEAEFDPFIEDEKGDYIYCQLVVGEKDMLGQMLRVAQARFPGTKYLCFQRQLRGDDRMRIWRMT